MTVIIWTIYLETRCQHNTYCVDDKSKIEPYLEKCMEELRKYSKHIFSLYEINWLAVDYAVIYKLDKNKKRIWERDGKNLKVFGKINRYEVH